MSTVQAVITVVVSILGLVVAWVSLRYRRREHRLQVEKVTGEDPKVVLFLSRDSMIKHLLSMYDRALEGDTIWGQTVGGGDYTSGVHEKVLKAAARGARLKIILNASSPAFADLSSFFATIVTAETAKGENNAIRIQGLSEREVVLAYTGMTSYTAVLIRDLDTVKIFKSWFDDRFTALKQSTGRRK